MSKTPRVTNAKRGNVVSDQPSTEAAQLLSSEGVTASAAEPTPAVGLDAAGAPSEPAASLAASNAPPSIDAAGTISTDTPPKSDDQSGAGDAAGSAGSPELGDALDALDGRGEYLDSEAEFRAKFPQMSAALDAWKADNGNDLPSALRIRSKHEGFRRAGIAHSISPTEHHIGAFTGPEQLEALFAEHELVVELI